MLLLCHCLNFMYTPPFILWNSPLFINTWCYESNGKTSTTPFLTHSGQIIWTVSCTVLHICIGCVVSGHGVLWMYCENGSHFYIRPSAYIYFLNPNPYVCYCSESYSGGLVHWLFKVFGMTWPGFEPQSPDWEADALTTEYFYSFGKWMTPFQTQLLLNKWVILLFDYQFSNLRQI